MISGTGSHFPTFLRTVSLLLRLLIIFFDLILLVLVINILYSFVLTPPFWVDKWIQRTGSRFVCFNHRFIVYSIWRPWSISLEIGDRRSPPAGWSFWNLIESLRWCGRWYSDWYTRRSLGFFGLLIDVSPSILKFCFKCVLVISCFLHGGWCDNVWFLCNQVRDYRVLLFLYFLLSWLNLTQRFLAFILNYIPYYNSKVTLTHDILDVLDRNGIAVTVTILETLDAQQKCGFENAGPLCRTELLQEVSHSLAWE